MITKAIVKSINAKTNRCIVRMPLFETASTPAHVKAEALVSITPGMFNNLFPGDIVFVAFEENALEKPIILGKLFKGKDDENNTPGGAGILNTLTVRQKASMPAGDTVFRFDDENTYKNFKTPQNIADYILWLEKYFKSLFTKIEIYFRCFKNWTQWQLQPENVEVDDGDIDDPNYNDVTYNDLLYQAERELCEVCKNRDNCSKNANGKTVREYQQLSTNNQYPNEQVVNDNAII